MTVCVYCGICDKFDICDKRDIYGIKMVRKRHIIRRIRRIIRRPAPVVGKALRVRNLKNAQRRVSKPQVILNPPEEFRFYQENSRDVDKGWRKT
jgi:hypothetical protein